MGLQFSTSYSNYYGVADASLDNLTVWSSVIWVYGVPSQPSSFWGKYDSDGALGYMWCDTIWNDATGWYANTRLANPSGNMSAQTASGTLTANKWHYLCISAQVLRNPHRVELFQGDLDTPISNVSNSWQDGTGDQTRGDDGHPLGLGANTRDGTGCNIPIGLFAIWNRVVTPAEMEAQRQALYPVITSGLLLFYVPGLAGRTGAQADWSGQSLQGSLYGATPTLTHSPPLPLYPPIRLSMPYISSGLTLTATQPDSNIHLAWV